MDSMFQNLVTFSPKSMIYTEQRSPKLWIKFVLSKMPT